MDWKFVVTTVLYSVGAGVALLVYWHNHRLEKARWMSSLYSKFYEQAELKQVREILDCEASDSLQVRKMVEEEPATLTDYLNFFEFMAYLRKSGQLSKKDVQALFDYYLGSMRKHEAVRKYIVDDSKGYGYLKELLLKI